MDCSFLSKEKKDERKGKNKIAQKTGKKRKEGKRKKIEKERKEKKRKIQKATLLSFFMNL